MFKTSLVLSLWFLELCVIKGGKTFRALLELFLAAPSIKWAFLSLKLWTNLKASSVSLTLFKLSMTKQSDKAS